MLVTVNVTVGVAVTVFVSVGVLIRAIQTRTRSMILSAAFGALGIVGAGLNGGSYLNYHEDISSMIMSAGFAVAVVSYLIGLYILPRRPTASASR